MAKSPKTSKKAGPTPATLKKGAARKQRSSQFTAYVNALTNSPRNARKDANARIALARIEKEIETGTVVRKVPQYTEERVHCKSDRTGQMGLFKQRMYETLPDGSQKQLMIESTKPLKPHEKVARIVKARQLKAIIAGSVDGVPALAIKLRPAFVEMLPTFAEETGVSAEELLLVGVPEADLVDAGLLEKVVTRDA